MYYKGKKTVLIYRVIGLYGSFWPRNPDPLAWLSGKLIRDMYYANAMMLGRDRLTAREKLKTIFFGY